MSARKTVHARPSVSPLRAGRAARERDELRSLAAALLRGRDEERHGLARTLHDGAAQTLAALAMQIDWLSGRTRGAKTAEELRSLRAIAREAIDDLSRVTRALGQPALERVGLGRALADLAAGASSPTLTAVLAPVPAALAGADGPVALAIFRIAEAALSNAARHGGARNVEVRLSFEGTSFRLEVADDGAGFDERKIEPGARLGLTAMRERVLALGGRFELDTAPGCGTRVRVSLPLGEADG